MLSASPNCSIYGTTCFTNFHKEELLVKPRGGSLVVEFTGSLPFAHWLMHKATGPKIMGSYFARFAGSFRVGDSGFEPLTSSASRKRSPPELIARAFRRSERRHPESNRGTGFCRPLPNHSAMPPAAPCSANRGQRAEDGIRTRDPHHGKVMLYQLSYFRARD